MSGKKKTTIKDLCDYTGLSLGTVSKYLNGGTLRNKNRIKIENAVREFDYTVDEYARGLVTRKTKTVGVLLPDFDNIFYARIVSQIERELERYGFTVIVRNSNYDLDKEIESILWFVSRRVDALILVPNGKSKEDYKTLEQVNIPVIFLDMWIPDLNCDFVVVNNREISRRGVNYLIEKGHKDIAVLCLKSEYYTAAMRLQGYLDAFNENGLPVDEKLIYTVDESIDSAYNVMINILKNKNCTAVYASNYTSTFGVVFALSESGANVPEDISFLGFDDLIATRMYRPKPAMINQPLEEIARVAAQRVAELTAKDGHEFEYVKTRLKCTFTAGDTVFDRN